MARSRNIKPGLFKNELLGTTDPLLTILFESLWCLADREGRLEDRPLRIKAETFPYRDKVTCSVVDAFLSDLERMGFIVRYQVGDVRLIQVLNFHRHQSPHKTEKPSELPAIHVKAPLSNGELTESERADSFNRIPDSLIPEGCSETPEASAEPANGDPVVLEFPVDGGEKTWRLHQHKLDEYRQSFPSLDVLAEFRKALQWVRDNPAKRKTPQGMPAFLSRWLGRQQNTVGGSRAPPRSREKARLE